MTDREPGAARRATRRVSDPPDGFRLVRDALSETEERALLARIAALAFEEVRFRGVIARRRVVHFGAGYAYAQRAIAAAEPMPAWLEPLRARAEQWTGIAAQAFEEALITHYPPGAGIGWHRDAPVFGPTVVGLSLAAPCALRFRRAVGAAWERFEIESPPRSGYVIGGAARAAWQHSIPPVRETRFSITLRTLRRPRAVGTAPAPASRPAPA
jgi:alkylated DNA repair dioxygenase AlkB